MRICDWSSDVCSSDLFSGAADAQARARIVLTELYGRLAQGRMIEMGDVDCAIRMARAEDAQGGQMNAPVITKSRDRNAAGAAGDRTVPEGAVRTTKRLIIPRSPIQNDYLTTQIGGAHDRTPVTNAPLVYRPTHET